MRRATLARAPRWASALLVAASLFSLPAQAGPPFVTDDPEPVPYQHWEINNALLGTVTQSGTLAGLPSIDANYGVLPGVQLHLQPQITAVWSDSATRIGLGDTQIGAKLRLIEDDPKGWMPMVAIFPYVTVPSGNARQGLGNGVATSFLPVWVQKAFGKWILDGGVGYEINPPAHIGGATHRNAWFFGGLLLYQLTGRLQLGGELFLQTAQAVGASSAPGFNLGGTYDLNETYHILFSAGQGVAHVSATNRFSFYLGVQLTY